MAFTIGTATFTNGSTAVTAVSQTNSCSIKTFENKLG